ncbi:MAG: flagellar biosynthetic protein FliR [Pelagibacterales bacterium]|nr:flagellar biosynthetic protein FliR [Pelagibacterales bacterium]OUU61180.1 MAG: flagellar biosynthetic protein FliR [Alphaproteobacteria bacterium TMED62]|tara:strand:+ start:4395 stop:5207 length:813 start_codon:yes stop_codon:yes gene_type:complete
MDTVNNFSQSLPGLELSGLVSIIGALALTSIRVGSFFLASPLFGYRIIPLQARIVISFAISFLIYNKVDIPNIESLAGLPLFSIILVELLIGITSGLLLTILFSASNLAGEKIAASTGLSFAGLIDPESGTQTPVLSQILSLFMIVVFLSLDGHLLAISVILESYNILPIGSTDINLSMIKLGIDAGGLMFKFGALIMLPLVVGITLLNVIIGIVTRSAPTLNLFSFGFPITMIFAFFLLYVCAITIGSNFSNLTNVAVDFLYRLVEGLM